MFKKKTLTVYIILATLVVTLVSGRFYLETEHAQRFIQDKINTIISGRVSWDKWNLSLLAGSFSLETLHVNGQNNDEIAEFQRIFLNISWRSFLKKELHIESAVVERPRVRLVIDSDNNINIVKAFSVQASSEKEKKNEPQSASTSPFNILVDDFKLIGGELQFEMPGPDPGTMQKLALSDIDLSLKDGDLLKPAGRITFNLVGGEVRMAAMNTRINRIHLDAAIAKGKIDPFEVVMDTELALLNIKGVVLDFLNAPVLDFKMELQGDLENIRTSFGLAPELTGPFDIRLAAQGKIENPNGELTLDYKGGLLAGNQLDGLTLDIQLRDRLIEMKDLEAKSPMGLALGNGTIDLRRVFNHGFLSPPDDLEAISYRISLKLVEALLEELPKEVADLSGKINARLDFEGSGISIEKLAANAELKASVIDLAVRPSLSSVSAEINAAIEIKNKLATVSNLDINALDAELHAKGEYDLTLQKLNAGIELTAPALKSLFSPLGIKDLTGAVKLNAHVAGSVDQPGVKFLLDGKNLAFEKITIGNVTVDSILKESGIIDIGALTVENQGSLIEARGTLGLFKEDFALNRDLPSDFVITFQNIEAEDFFKDMDVKGSAEGNVNLSGSLAFPNADLDLHVKSLTIGTQTLGDFDTKVNLTGGTVTLKEFQINNAKSSLNLAGKIQALDPQSGKPAQDPIFDVTLASDGIFLEDFLPEFKGSLTLNGDVNGSVMTPKGHVLVTGNKIDLGIQKIDTLRISATLDGEKVHLQPLLIALAPNQEILGQGWVRPLDGEYDLRLKSQGILFDNIGSIKKLKLVAGSMAIDLQGKGRFNNPSMSGDIRVTEFFLNNRKTDDINLQVDLRDGIATIATQFHAALNAMYELKTKKFTADALFDGSDLRPLFVLVGREGLSGSVSGNMHAEGDVDTPDSIQAQAEFTEFSILQDSIEIIRAEEFKAGVKDRRIVVPGIRLALMEKGYIEIRGKAELDGMTDLETDGIIPLKVLNSFSEEIDDLAGTVVLSAKMKGPMNRPDINAEVKLKKVELTVPGLYQKLHDLNGELHLTPEAATLSSFNGYFDSGRFDLSGKSTLKGLKPTDMNLQLKLEKVPVSVPDIVDITFNGDLTFHGSPEDSVIAGEIFLLEGLYHKNIEMNLLQAMQEKKRSEAPVPLASPHPYLRNIALDINVKHRNPFHVDNNIALLSLKPTLLFHGKLANPLLSGRAEVESGTITFQKKEFEVTKGIIDFQNPYKIEPTIDVTSRTEIRKWTIILKVSGNPENLIFNLTSTPSEEYGDIISLIIFGKTTKELIRNEGGKGTSPTQLVADMVAGKLQESITGATGLDMIELKYQENASGNGMGTTDVTVGKELSRRLMVKYGFEASQGEMRQKVSTEYKILERLLLTAFQSTGGVFGGELAFQLEFR